MSVQFSLRRFVSELEGRATSLSDVPRQELILSEESVVDMEVGHGRRLAVFVRLNDASQELNSLQSEPRESDQSPWIPGGKLTMRALMKFMARRKNIMLIKAEKVPVTRTCEWQKISTRIARKRADSPKAFAFEE